MVRTYWKGTLVAVALSCSGLAIWAQPALLPAPGDQGVPVVQAPAEPAKAMPNDPVKPTPADPGTGATTPAGERIMTICEPGCPARQVRVLREWQLPDGNTATEVQALDNGEKMTIVCGCNSVTHCVGEPICRVQGQTPRIFRWAHNLCAPGCPTPACKPECKPSCQPACGTACGPNGCKEPHGDNKYRDACTGEFDNQKYLNDLRCKNGELPGAPVPGPEQIHAPVTKGDAKPSLLGNLFAPKETTATAPAPTQQPTWKKMFGGNDEVVVKDGTPVKTPVATKDSSKVETASSAGSGGDFNKDAYLNELRAKFGGAKPADGSAVAKADKSAADKKKEELAKAEQKKKDEKAAADKKKEELARAEQKKKDEKAAADKKKEELAKAEQKKKDDASKVAKATPPTATAPKSPTPPPPPPAPSAVANAKTSKPAVETAQPTDWRKSWGKTETQVAVAEKPETKELPVARVEKADPLMDADRYTKPKEVASSPLAGAKVVEEKKVPVAVAKDETAPVKQVAAEAPGVASTAKLPSGMQSVMAAYGDNGQAPGKLVYMPVPMMTVPPTAHNVRPPQGPPGTAPAPVQQAYANAFTAEGSVMPAGYPGQPMPMNMMPPQMQQAMMQQAMMQQQAMMAQQAMMQQQAMMAQQQQAMMYQGGGYMPAPVAGQQVDPQAAQQLVQTLRDSIYPSQREFAAESLAKLDYRVQPQIFDALLTAARDDAAATVRSCCVRCLSNMNVNSGVLVMTLQALKADADPRVRLEVEQALAKMPGSKTSLVPPSAVQPASVIVPADPK